MEYNKAIENYRKISDELNSKIREREDKIEQLKADIKNIKEGRKEEIKKGIFSNTIKKFTKTNDITDKATEIEVLMCEIEALQEMKQGESKELMKAARELVKSVAPEKERIEKERKAKEEEADKLYKKVIELRNELSCNNEAAMITSAVVGVMNELIKAKYPKEYEVYASRGLNLFGLAERIIEE